MKLMGMMIPEDIDPVFALVTSAAGFTLYVAIVRYQAWRARK